MSQDFERLQQFDFIFSELLVYLIFSGVTDETLAFCGECDV